MPEHTPAPTPSRSTYGFVLYLCCKTFFYLYLLWAIVPEPWFVTLNITYLPQRYWAVTFPVFLLTILAAFAFIIYPSLNLCMTPSIQDLRTVTESVQKLKISNNYKTNASTSTLNPSCYCVAKETCFVKEYIKTSKNVIKYSVPMVEDLCIADVSKTLYLK